LERRRRENPLSVLTEFEKDRGIKRIFAQFDPSKDSFIILLLLAIAK
jgi:hypothetical protein